jgi:hypothetical protein
LRRPALELLAISFVVLFQELALIRWLPSQVRVLAYFPNLMLISAFLGLGIGCLRAEQRSLFWLWPLSLVILVCVFVSLGSVVFTQNSVSEHLWLLYYNLPDTAPVVRGVELPIVLAFCLSGLTFVPLGQIVAERLNRFAERSQSLWGYFWDLAGSLGGVIGFAVVGFLEIFPLWWFVVFMGVGLAVFAPRNRNGFAYLGGAALVLAVVGSYERSIHYSPYYAISTVEAADDSGQISVLTNGSLHQHALSLRRSDPVRDDWHARILNGYHHPFRMLKQPPRRVLVLGAGTGNDVAVLLDEGAREIDAVEIDPVILEIGRRNHPNRPYDSPRVRTINSDARSYLNNTDKKYDLIVFGTLDSMTRLSALSNVRLDNFVYTLDCIRAARQRLTNDGGMVLYFMVAKRYIHDHLVGILAAAFGDLPHFSLGNFGMFNSIYLAGPAFSHLPSPGPGERERYFAQTLPSLAVPTDDWPYLYLSSRGISNFYLTLMAVFLVLAALAVFGASREMRSSLTREGGIDLEMFLFGLAFLLIETKFITAMNLLWGATWLTSAVVFGSILAMVMLGTAVVQLAPMPWWTAASGLLIALLVTYVVPVHALLGHVGWAKLALSVAYVGTPVFFASTCFALRFRTRKRANLAFGWNLLGAVAGGLMEFFSMAVGLGALSLVAAAAYLGALWIRTRAEALPRSG